MEIALLDCYNRKKDLISHRGTLVNGFVNISVYFDKLANNFMEPLDRFFKRIKILLAILIQTENSVVSHFFIFIPIADAICHTLFFEWR